jgi:hypothetical protein
MVGYDKLIGDNEEGSGHGLQQDSTGGTEKYHERSQ